MLRRLMNVHAELLVRIAALAKLAEDAAPQRMALSGERWRMSTLMAARMKLVDDEIYPQLFRTLSVEDRVLLAKFREEGMALRARFREHLDVWTAERVFEDWHAYRMILMTMLPAAVRRIEEEKYILYPLLESPSALRG